MGEQIRMATGGDAEATRDIYAPFVAMSTVSFEAEPPDATEMARRISHQLETHPWLVCGDDERILGYAYAGEFRVRAAYRWSCEVSVYLAHEAQGAGLGRRLYRALFDLLARQGYRQAFAGVTLPNPASVALHESMGFEPIGVYRDVGFKLGAWHDVGWWQLALGDERGDPKPIVPIAQVAAAADWARY